MFFCCLVQPSGRIVCPAACLLNDFDPAAVGFARDLSLGHRHRSGSRPVWFAPVWFALVWFALVWFALVWFALVWFALVWFALVWFALVWFALVCRRSEWSVVDRNGLSSIGMVCRRSEWSLMLWPTQVIRAILAGLFAIEGKTGGWKVKKPKVQAD
ncbi:hypothetical protein [Stieleria bergensis]|uniref:hypothetical protein n=1 Tax=Stieleria bergensis TaxID=2528025 RepID=UPI003AF3D24D